MPLATSRRAAGIAPSATLAIDARAKEMKKNGEKVIGFAAGEPDFSTPSAVCDAAHEAINRGFTRYTPTGGIPELKRAICDKFMRDNRLAYEPSNVIVCTGAKQALMGAFFACLDPGDEVIIPSPFWVSYPEMVRIAGGVPVCVECFEANGFVPTIESIRDHVTPRTRAILINSPSNPTGAIFDRRLLEAIAQLALERRLYIISDEIYENFLYDGAEHTSIASLSDAIRAQTIVVNGVSKTHAMTGWRIGYAAGPEHIIRAMDSLQSHVTGGPNSIAQYASLAALQGDHKLVGSMRDEFNARRIIMVDRVNRIKGLSAYTPKGAFYVMVNCQAILCRFYNGKQIGTAARFCEIILEEAKVAAIPGEPFGAPAYIRLSYAVSREDIRDGLDAIDRFVQTLP